MSACVILYKPNPSLVFNTYDDLENWQYEDLSKRYFYIKEDELGSFKGYRYYHRFKKILDNFQWNTLYDKQFGKLHYLCCETVEYRQGWFFTDKFFNYYNNHHFICTTKKSMMNCMLKYFDLKFTKKSNTFRKKDIEHCREAREAYLTFCKAWKDGMIFELSW